MSDNQVAGELLSTVEPDETRRVLVRMSVPLLIFLAVVLPIGGLIACSEGRGFWTTGWTRKDVIVSVLYFLVRLIPDLLLLRFAFAAMRATSMSADKLPDVLEKLLHYWWYMAAMTLLVLVGMIAGLTSWIM